MHFLRHSTPEEISQTKSDLWFQWQLVDKKTLWRYLLQNTLILFSIHRNLIPKISNYTKYLKSEIFFFFGDYQCTSLISKAWYSATHGYKFGVLYVDWTDTRNNSLWFKILLLSRDLKHSNSEPILPD